MLERLLWNVFNYGETYTFVLVWIVIPLTFLACFLWLRGASDPVEMAVPVKVHDPVPVAVAARVTQELAPIAEDPKVNTNEANA